MQRSAPVQDRLEWCGNVVAVEPQMAERQHTTVLKMTLQQNQCLVEKNKTNA
jgi:hypothetical protein